MCQGVIFVWNKSKNEYHWGTGSHTSLIHRVWPKASNRAGDYLVRVECDLGSGPGHFSLQGGEATNGELAVFKDKILDMVGTPQKLGAYVVQKVMKEGFNWERSFVRVLNIYGRDALQNLSDEWFDEQGAYRNSLTKEEKRLFDRIWSIEHSDGRRFTFDLCELQTSIYLVLAGYAKRPLHGGKLEAALKKARTDILDELAAGGDRFGIEDDRENAAVAWYVRVPADAPQERRAVADDRADLDHVGVRL